MMRSRYRRIMLFFSRVLLSLIAWEILIPHIGLGKVARGNRSRRLRTYAIGFRKMSVEMGGVLIKVGQFLSSRVDVLPMEITGELSQLQDEVPPEKFENIRDVAEAELKMPLNSKFLTFDEVPIAAASLGQAHHATLLNRISTSNSQPSIDELEVNTQDFVKPIDGDEIIDVVVKIQRKDIEILIATDLAALRTIGKWLQRYPPIKKRANIPALLEEFTRTLYEEIDYIAEGRNAETFSKNFKSDPCIIVPRVIWSHTTKRVLTLEDVRGIKINDYAGITSSGIHREDVASRLFNTYLKQIFEDGFFHADPHPGNLFVSRVLPDEGEFRNCPDWVLTFVDFGMVGRIPQNVYDSLRDLLIAVGTRDTTSVVQASQKLGFLLPGADIELLIRAEEKLFDRFWGKNMMEISQVDPGEMIEFAREFRELMFILPFQVPQDILFLGRAVGILSGMCTGLNPKFNVWDHLVPYAKKIISEDIHNPEKWIETIGIYIKRMIGLPNRIETIINKLERGEISVHEVELADQVKRMEITIRRLTTAILFFTLFIGGVLFYRQGELYLSIFLIVFSVILFLIMIIRS